ncbi:MAG: hypothetical protein ACLQT6_15225, partial [Desulfomonilaceae bacterium]
DLVGLGVFIGKGIGGNAVVFEELLDLHKVPRDPAEPGNGLRDFACRTPATATCHLSVANDQVKWM